MGKPAKKPATKAAPKRKRNNAVAAPPARIGRPDLLTPQTSELIVLALRAANYLHVAAAAAGIHRDTLNHWLHRGASDKRRGKVTKFSEFSDAVQKATAEGEVTLVASMAKAAKAGQWQAAARILEAKDPERWGRKERVQLSGDPEAPVRLLVYIPKESDE